MVLFFIEYEGSACSNSVYSADDKAGHNTLHSAVGDYIPEKKIQVRKVKVVLPVNYMF